MSRNLKRVNQFLAEHPEYTSGQLRWWIFRAAENGMDEHGVVARIGRAVWINEPGFDRWLVAQNPGLKATERNAQERAQ